MGIPSVARRAHARALQVAQEFQAKAAQLRERPNSLKKNRTSTVGNTIQADSGMKLPQGRLMCTPYGGSHHMKLLQFHPKLVGPTRPLPPPSLQNKAWCHPTREGSQANLKNRWAAPAPKSLVRGVVFGNCHPVGQSQQEREGGVTHPRFPPRRADPRTPVGAQKSSTLPRQPVVSLGRPAGLADQGLGRALADCVAVARK